MGGVTWNIPCDVKTKMSELSAVLAYKYEFLSQAGKQQRRGLISHTKKRDVITLYL